jgi:aminoglycoside phosphotransferase (APT) family kinase protein
MPRRTAAQIKSRIAMVKKIMKHHFGIMPTRITHMPAGLTNYVFEASCKAGEFIVRIAGSAGKISNYMKEQWAVEHARKNGVPVAEILEVGNEIVSVPYMLQAKLKGTEAVNHPDRLEILKELGKYAQLIHSIQTSNYGGVFDWSKNRLSKNKTLKEYLHEEFRIDERLNILEKHDMLTAKHFKKLTTAIGKIERLNPPPALNHGDLRLKNVIVNEKGKILALIDWENCTSNIAPHWDLSIALHDLSIDGKQHFLEGYGIDPNEFSKIAYAIKAFNILNYTDTIERIKNRKDASRLEFYRLRLKGYMDLFSV